MDTDPPVPCPAGEFFAKYLPNQLLAGPPSATACVPSVDENWGEGGPEGLPANNFGATYEGSVRFDEADYEFVGGSDDGIRVYLDGDRIIDDWVITDSGPRRRGGP